MPDHDRQDTLDLLRGRLLRLTREVTDLATAVSDCALEVNNTVNNVVQKGQGVLPSVRAALLRGLEALDRLEAVTADRDRTHEDLRTFDPKDGGPR